MAIDKDLTQIGDLLEEGIKTGIDKLKDGFQYTDVFAFIPVLSKIPEAIEDANNALNYLKEMSEEKEGELVEYVSSKLGADAQTKELARRIIRTTAEIYMLVLNISERRANGSSTPEAPATPA